MSIYKTKTGLARGARFLAALIAAAVVLASLAGCALVDPDNPGGTTPGGDVVPVTVSFTKNDAGTVVEFSALPTTLAQLEAMDASYLQTPEYAAAMTAAIMCHWIVDTDETVEMIEYINGPNDFYDNDVSFYNDRFRDGKEYKVNAYFVGAAPANDYTPTLPYRVVVTENAHTYDVDGQATFYLNNGGADSPRPVVVRNKPSTGEWFLQSMAGMYADIRVPDSQNPWA